MGVNPHSTWKREDKRYRIYELGTVTRPNTYLSKLEHPVINYSSNLRKLKEQQKPKSRRTQEPSIKPVLKVPVTFQEFGKFNNNC